MKNTFERHTTVHRGDIFYVNLGKPDGTSKQAGIRPVFICSNRVCNNHSPIITVCSISTSRTKHPIPTHIPLLASETGLNRDSVCLCSCFTKYYFLFPYINISDITGFIISKNFVF